MPRMNVWLLTFWEYAVEIIAAAMIYLLLVIVKGSNALSHLVFTRRTELGIAVGLAVGIGGVLFAAYITILCTEFGAQLRLAGHAKAYITGFAAPIFIFLASGCGLLFLPGDVDGWGVRLVSILLLYSIINCYTMVKNMVGLVRIWQDVERAKRFGAP